MTPQTQFTPGPYRVDRDPANPNGDLLILSGPSHNSKLVAVLPSDLVEREQGEVDAQLLASSPSLYAALQAMLECAEIGDLESLANAAVNARKALDLANA